MFSKYRIITVAAALFVVLSAAAQNLDPTVEVSRAYEGKLMEVHKPQLKMAVPDSVMRFDLDFDYSVSDSPYKGAYEFRPYTLDMKPSPTYRDVNTFYLKAGAGYQLHPVLDMVWSPLTKGAFRMNAYASHRSFIGNYYSMPKPYSPNKTAIFARMEDETWSGYDLRSRAGVEGQYDWNKFMMGFDLGYYGLHQKDKGYDYSGRAYDALDAYFSVVSKNDPDSRFRYHADVAYRFAKDRLNESSIHIADVLENDFSLDGSADLSLRNGDRLGLKLGFGMSSIHGFTDAGAVDVDVVPHYVIDRKRWKFDLGVRVSASYNSKLLSDMYSYDEQMIYPDVRIEVKAIPDAMKIYLRIGGDSKANTYSDIIAYNHRADIRYGRSVGNVLDIVDERISVAGGFDGRIGKRFSYVLEGGYANYGNALLDAVVMQQNMAATSSLWLPGLGYASFDKAFASLGWLLDAEHFRFDGKVEYAYYSSQPVAFGRGHILPAPFTGDVALTYDVKDRVFFGVDCCFSTRRYGTAYYMLNDYTYKSLSARVPGYADLGLEIEYVASRKFSAWARGGNLLGMTVQKSILYAEKGPYFTLGICLNL